jgi:hypothetical protein
MSSSSTARGSTQEDFKASNNGVGKFNFSNVSHCGAVIGGF